MRNFAKKFAKCDRKFSNFFTKLSFAGNPSFDLHPCLLLLPIPSVYSFCLFLLPTPSAYSFCLFLLSISLRTVCFLNPSFSPTLPKIHIRKFTDTRCWVASLKIIQAFKNSMQRSQLLYFLTKRQGDGDKIEN